MIIPMLRDDTAERFEGYLRRRLGDNYSSIVLAALDALADYNADDETISQRNGLRKAGNMHESTFDFIQPTLGQKAEMDECRAAAKRYYEVLEAVLPDGPDKNFVIRRLRDIAMWANVAITRHSDGVPRQTPPRE